MANNSKKIQKTAKKVVKNTHKITIICAIVFLILGLGVGILPCYFMTKNDTFELIGEKEYTIAVGEDFSYTEEGVIVKALGQDLSSKVVTSTNIANVNLESVYTIDTTKEGKYYIEYTVDCHKYKNIKRYRVFNVVEGGANG